MPPPPPLTPPLTPHIALRPLHITICTTAPPPPQPSHPRCRAAFVTCTRRWGCGVTRPAIVWDVGSFQLSLGPWGPGPSSRLSSLHRGGSGLSLWESCWAQPIIVRVVGDPAHRYFGRGSPRMSSLGRRGGFPSSSGPWGDPARHCMGRGVLPIVAGAMGTRPVVALVVLAP